MRKFWLSFGLTLALGAGILLLGLALFTLLSLLGGCAEPPLPTLEAPRTVPPSPMITELPAVNWPDASTAGTDAPGYVHETAISPAYNSPLPTGTANIGPAPTSTPVPTREVFTSTLPVAARAYSSTVEPPAAQVEIYDCDGGIVDTHWLTTTFGAVSWSRVASDTTRLSTLWSCCGDCPAVHVVHVEDEAGQAVEGAPVVLYWPQGPWLPSELYHCGLMRGVVGYTNANGDVGFGLGRGAYYEPPAGGPHVVWVGNASECLSGIGMLLNTNHAHVDSGWAVQAGELEAVAGPDQVFVPGTLVYPAVIDGQSVPVVVWPEWGWER